jgi:hypothetical protein
MNIQRWTKNEESGFSFSEKAGFLYYGSIAVSHINFFNQGRFKLFKITFPLLPSDS